MAWVLIDKPKGLIERNTHQLTQILSILNRSLRFFFDWLHNLVGISMRLLQFFKEFFYWLLCPIVSILVSLLSIFYNPHSIFLTDWWDIVTRRYNFCLDWLINIFSILLNDRFLTNCMFGCFDFKESMLMIYLYFTFGAQIIMIAKYTLISDTYDTKLIFAVSTDYTMKV